ncbi:branched-chain amino acid ABC transporter substrate-binding protein [Deinococcus peraridilitoris]|uniref:ABC-type branched-chain amino acid transport system, periplasmic component n=1 Tax=Deinococcus peraridilitoris (strain DSM 19664 / LMG 22246 / CIP 109416 / KR-200) TaxID=937777 RepID=K9ZW83_DEIPD|nr:branched-chain amino acid ABC transporter substrate-binding protein [Deinococcus peraridilitoris]AFZ65903.1 ABC-type branched-chain amino acid transport system, periplasmic component [Deinococcus peraridilitoris DSM 19664]
MKKTGFMTMALLGALSLGNALAQTQTIKIATLSPLSGAQSNLGQQIKNGAQLAVNEYKAEFQKLGFNLQMVSYDDQADPTTGTANARKIAADRSILAVVGTLNSGVAIPASAALAPSKLAMVSPANTANAVTDRGLSNMNRIVARDDAQGPAAGKYIADTLKAKKVYVLNDKTAYGEGLAQEVEKYLKSKGVQIVSSEGTEEKSNFQPLVIKIKALNPDVIYFGSIYDQAAVFIKQLRDAGVTAKVMGGDGWDSSDLQKIGGNSVKGALFTTVAAPIAALPAAGKFAEAYKKSFNSDAQGFGAFGYDAGKVTLQGVLAAIKANGNKMPTRAQVESAIRKVNATGLLSGNVRFNSVGDRQSAKMYIMEVQDSLDTKAVETVTVEPPRK